MISRKTTMVIANAYTSKFSNTSYSSETIYRDKFYDFLYEHEYEAWFCNMVKGIFYIRDLQEWILQIHTGESLVGVTPNWPWDKRREFGQVYLRNLARDFIMWYRSAKDDFYIQYYRRFCDEMTRRLEIDGYVFRDDELYQTEIEILDVETETGLLQNLHSALNLSDRQETFEFLKLTEDHYVSCRWSDSISNARKFFEVILQQVAYRHASAAKGTILDSSTLQRPVAVREYLENEGLLEKKEREAVDKIYGLLSHTGGHPYMAEKDQARLLRQISLTVTQFIMLRLEGALKQGLPNKVIQPTS
jgi:hypothetical protein